MRFDNTNIYLSDDEDYNFIQIGYEDFLLQPLTNNFYKSKGASSNLFILNDPTGEIEDRVIKICKSPISWGKDRRLRRFKREIQAFKRVKTRKLTGIIEFYKDSPVEIDGEEFLCFIMEKATEDLPSFMERKKFDFTISQKLTFCVSILNGIKQLHSIGIYHRDIKHDNILVVNNEFKIGDLGLVQFQDRDYEFDYADEKIGPFGWLCPEATNKMLTGGKDIIYNYDCEIDTASDVFQLGKLFWYVFQGNLPLGQILAGDYEIAEEDIYQVIFSMLQYKKSRRPTIKDIEDLLAPLRLKYAV